MAAVLILSDSIQKVMFRSFPTEEAAWSRHNILGAYVCRFRVHVRADAFLVAYFDRKGNPMPWKFSLVFVGRRNSGSGLRLLPGLLHFLFPGAGLLLDQVDSH